LIVKQDGTREEFDREKLMRGLRISCAKRPVSASDIERMVGEIEAKCNAEIAAAHDVRVQILPRAEAFQIPDLIRTKINLLPAGISEVRTVEIVGLDLQADGGTHVANTSEVGTIRVTDYKSKGAINKRIYISVG